MPMNATFLCFNNDKMSESKSRHTDRLCKLACQQ